MRITGSILVIIFFILVTGCSATVEAPVGNREGISSTAYHVVQKGEGLYFISWQYGIDYMELARWNRIEPPYTIYPGQKIYLRPPHHRARKKIDQKAATATVRSRKKTYKPDTAVKPPGPTEKNIKVTNWMWPARGKVIRYFSAHDNGKKGIAISGRMGDPILATAGGKVVYSGNGLVRYGQMVIIKHNNQYLSAYAHNRKILVKEGETVKQGQKIAEMGNTGTTQVMLHFEIRKYGKPVNPLQYLRKQ